MTTIILARDMRMASDLAGLLELRGRDWRFATSMRSIDGVRFKRAYIHPLFWDRPDKHAILDAVRRASYRNRDTEVIELRQDAIDALEEVRGDSEATRAAISVLAEQTPDEAVAELLAPVEGLES